MAPSLVQVAANAASAASVTVTLGSPTTGANTLVALFGTSANSSNGSPSGITLGGSADNWAQSAIQGSSGDHAISAGWADPNCAGGQTSVVITLTGGSGDLLFAWVFEWSGLSATVDVSSGAANSFSSTWTSGTTGSTTQADEVAFGITCGAANTAGAAGLAGPASPWVNEAQQSLAGSSHTKCAIAGYQVLSSTGTQVYSGTASPANTNDTLVFTLLAASPPPVSPSGLLMASII